MTLSTRPTATSSDPARADRTSEVVTQVVTQGDEPVAGVNGRRELLGRLLVTCLAAVTALLISVRLPLLGPLLVALGLGVVCANLRPISRHVVGQSPTLDRLLLRTGVALLGLKVVLADVLDLGLGGLVVVLGTVVTTYAVTQMVGRLLGLERGLTTLIAAGFSICGAAAVAAVESSIRAKARDVALAVAMVTVFGSAMIVVIPVAGHLLGLSHEQTAVWAGASIHEVAQVLAAAALVGGGGVALATATTVKLARVALLAPVQVVSGRVCRTPGATRQGPLVPLFLLGFLAAMGIRATGLLSAGALTVAGDVTTFLLAAAMFGLGTTVVARQLWPFPLRALALAAIATVTAGGVSLALVALLV